MGEYILYCNGKSFRGNYDDRFLVKLSKSAVIMMPNAKKKELSCERAGEMVLVDHADDRIFLSDLVQAMLAELIAARKRKRLNPRRNNRGILCEVIQIKRS
ncbi:MAG: competence protein TfoX [Eubacteriales bacterium]|nr:competence protein TfoX [Eubacteriales bacterium]